ERLGIKDNKNTQIESYFDMTSEDGRMLQALFVYMSTNDVQVKNINISNPVSLRTGVETAEIEFKILPNVSELDVNKHLNKIMENINVSWDISDFQEGFFNDIDPSLNKIIQNSIKKHGFKGETLPFLAFGKTDGRFLKNASVFGFSPVNSTTPFS